MLTVLVGGLNLHAAQTPTDGGVYYIYNEYSGKFLSRGDAWGARAVVDNYGLPIKLTLSEGKFYMAALDNNITYGDDYWMYGDADGGRARAFTIEEAPAVEGTGYLILNPNHGMRMYVYLKDDADKYAVAGNGIKNDNYADDGQTIWQFLSQAERDKVIADREKAEKEAAYAGLDIKNSTVGAATVVPFNNTWTFTPKRDGSSADFNAWGSGLTEVYQGTGTFTKTVDGIAEGLYEITITALQRGGSNEGMAAAYANGYDCTLAYLDANGTTTRVTPWAKDQTNNNPNQPNEASEAFNAGKYVAKTYARVGVDGKLNLTVTIPQFNGASWFIAKQITYAPVEQTYSQAALVNGSFDQNPNYTAAATGNLTTGGSGNSMDVDGWTMVQSDAWCASASYEYGTAAQLNSANIPAAGPDGSASTAALGVTVGWGGTALYTQDVTLPAGVYLLTYKAYNTTTVEQFQSKVGVKNGANEYLSTKTSYAAQTWEAENIEFTLAADATVTVQVGGTAVSGGSGSNAKMLFDDIEILSFPTEADRDAYLATAEYYAAVEAAEAALADPDNQLAEAEVAALQALISADKPATAADILAAKHDIETATKTMTDAAVTAKYNKILADYPQEVSNLLPDLADWTNSDMGLTTGVQHWDPNQTQYWEQGGSSWSANSWENYKTTTITLPKGKYAIFAPGRAAKGNLEVYMMAGAQKVVYENNGDLGFGVDVNGVATVDPTATYNGTDGKGWAYQYIEFEMADKGEITFKVGGKATQSHMWMSFTQPSLRAAADVLFDPTLGAPTFDPHDGAIIPQSEMDAKEGVTVTFGASDAAGVDPATLTYDASFDLYKDGNLEASAAFTGIAFTETSLVMFNDYEFLSGSTYEVRSEIGEISLTDGVDTWTNDAAYSTTFQVTPEMLVTGDYVIKNVANGKYLGAANSWGTRSSTVPYSHLWTVSRDGDTYSLDSHTSNGGSQNFLGTNLFVDSDKTPWTIIPLGANMFTISNASGYLASQDGDGRLETVQLADATTDNAKWIILNTKQLAVQARAQGSSENPYDLSGFIKDAGFSRNNSLFSAWVGGPAKGGANENMCAEKYNCQFDVYQKLEGLPEGTYLVTMQGFYRAGFSGNAAAAHEAGTEDLKALFYATGTNTVSTPVMSIIDEDAIAGMDYSYGGTSYSDTQYGKIPNNMTAASWAFDQGFYNNSLVVQVGSNGLLTIGVKKDAANDPDGNWTIFDNFTIAYMGSAKTNLKVDPQVELVELNSNAEEGTKDLTDGTNDYTVDNEAIKEGIIMSFQGAVIDNPWFSNYRVKATILDMTPGYQNTYELVADAPNKIHGGEMAEFDVVKLAKGLFAPNTTYQVTINEVTYTDFTRFCDEFPGLLALGYDGCDPAPLWISANYPMVFTITTGDDVVQDPALARKQIISVVDEDGNPVNPFEAWDIATGINGINNLGNAVIYNLNGQRVSAPVKGMYIINGKKVLVK